MSSTAHPATSDLDPAYVVAWWVEEARERAAVEGGEEESDDAE